MTAAPWRLAFLARHALPEGYLDTARRYFDPLAARLAREAGGASSLLVGLNGSQGSGKSTLCEYLCAALEREHGLSAIALSLDDFYLTRDQRSALAHSVHPLLRTRGVPGTHDMRLLGDTLSALAGPARSALAVPRFDKASDDRAPAAQWTRVQTPLRVVLLEGWCLGARPVPEPVLQVPVNEFEAGEDQRGIWRRYSNRALAAHFEPLYARIDFWVMLAAPGFERVLDWRREQEARLRARRGAGAGLMDERALRRFVAHFERYTRQCLSELPEQVDVLLQLDADRNIIEARGLES